LPVASARALDLSIEESDPEEEDYPGSSHFAQTTCERCGFLRLHDIHVVLGDSHLDRQLVALLNTSTSIRGTTCC
jgi:hypothetical protein